MRDLIESKTLNIKKYEAIAMFDLSDGERKKISERAGFLAESSNMLEKIDTDGIEPLVSVLDIHTVLREDKSEKVLTRDEILANAPEQYDGYFQVPGTLE